MSRLATGSLGRATENTQLLTAQLHTYKKRLLFSLILRISAFPTLMSLFAFLGLYMS